MQDECFSNVSKHFSSGLSISQNFNNPQVQHLSRLLSSLQNHLLAYCSLTTSEIPSLQSSVKLLEKHLLCLFSLAGNTFSTAASVIETYPKSLELLYNIMLDSLAGAMLLKILNALLLLPISYYQPLLFSLLKMMSSLDRLNSLLPEEVHNEADNSVSGKFILWFYMFLRDSNQQII